eukprot:3201347-Amphidinium_carterae.2
MFAVKFLLKLLFYHVLASLWGWGSTVGDCELRCALDRCSEKLCPKVNLVSSDPRPSLGTPQIPESPQNPSIT